MNSEVGAPHRVKKVGHGAGGGGPLPRTVLGTSSPWNSGDRDTSNQPKVGALRCFHSPCFTPGEAEAQRG